MNIPELLQQLTLEEKASLCSGGDFWHTKATGAAPVKTTWQEFP